MKKDLYLGGEKLKEEIFLPPDIKDYFKNFLKQVLGLKVKSKKK